MTSGEGVVTRMRKIEVRQRDSLWDLIVNNDDISLTHIIPRLNATDIKFLYGVNTETRKLIKRSTRASDLEKRFKVEEMSSISTLEFAWEHKSLWPSVWDESSFSHNPKAADRHETSLISGEHLTLVSGY